MTTARTPLPRGSSVRLGRVHTIRIPDPLWDLSKTRADELLLRDGVSEIVRDLLEEHGREILRAHGIEIGDRETITQAHADLYYDRVFAAETIAES
jgi:hypothetical protein